MSAIAIGVLGFAMLGVLIYAGVHISTALLLTAFVGTWCITGDFALGGKLLGLAATDAVAEYEFGTVPLFVLMGFLVMVAGHDTTANTMIWTFTLLSLYPDMRRRLEAEALRDSALAVAGKLNLKMGGRPVVPPLTTEEAASLWARNQWPEALDPREHDRRTVYLYVKRTFPLPLMTTFDSPDTSVSCSRRDRTTVAPQALTLLNGEFMQRQAREFAARLRRENGAEARVELAWKLAFGRAPRDEEKRTALTALGAEGDAALDRFCLVLLNTNEFLYVD